MSIALMAASYRRVLPPHLRQVLLILCDHANDDGTHCHPSVPLIAWKLDISERAVLKSLQELERIGVIGIHRTTGLTNHYTIDLDSLPEKQPFMRKTREPQFTREQSSPVNSRTGVPVNPSSPPPVNSSTKTREPQFTLTTNEPSDEPPGEPPQETRAKKPARRQTEIPDDFTLTDDRLAYATEHGLSERDARLEFETLRNWAESKGEKKLNWDATWRNWVLRREKERPRAMPSANGRASPFEKTRAAFAEVDAALDDWIAQQSRHPDAIDTTGRRHA